MRKVLRLFDWKFLASLTALILTVAVVHSSLAAAHDRDRFVNQLDREHAAAAKERVAATHERALILEGQRDIQRKYDSLVDQQRALLLWLRGRGIYVPDELVAAENTGSSGDDGNHDGGDSSSNQRGSGKQSPPKSGSSTNTHGSSSGGSGKGQGAGGGHDKGHGSSSSSGGSKGKAKGHTKAKGHKDGKGH